MIGTARLLQRWLDVGWPWRAAAALAWGGLIWWASSRPARTPQPGRLQPFLHNAAHLGVYAVLAGLVFCALPPGRPLRRAAAAAAVATLYGAIDEWHQSHVSGRVASLGDLTTDLAGAVFGVSCLLWLWRRQPGTLALAVSAFVVGCLSVSFETFFP